MQMQVELVPMIGLRLIFLAAIVAVPLGILALLINRRTRGFALAGLGVGMGLLVLLFFARSSVHTPATATMNPPPMNALEFGPATTVPPMMPQSTVIEAVESPLNAQPTAEVVSPVPTTMMATPPAVAPPVARPTTAKGVLSAIAHAVGRALEGKKEATKPLPVPVEAVSAQPVRPGWVDEGSSREGDVYYETACVGPFTTREECDDALPPVLQRVLNEYAEMTLGHAAPTTGIDLRSLVYRKFEQRIGSSVGPMVQLFVRAKVDSTVRGQLEENWRRGIVAGRLQSAGVILAGILGVLAVVFGYLKIDEATHGAYRLRMRLTATIALVVLVVLALSLVA